MATVEWPTSANSWMACRYWRTEYTQSVDNPNGVVAKGGVDRRELFSRECRKAGWNGLIWQLVFLRLCTSKRPSEVNA
ncbi:unnamed protein product [Protopolystoma xenopodis]|uniref:Uncharacterized protein n=1 Tax=Protopolystoma xenopodis TaxID=117903 RepID=A0A448WPH6_9PLAT|nr:unnamed protein product [Protopolystoma xenopodis]